MSDTGQEGRRRQERPKTGMMVENRRSLASPAPVWADAHCSHRQHSFNNAFYILTTPHKGYTACSECSTIMPTHYGDGEERNDKHADTICGSRTPTHDTNALSTVPSASSRRRKTVKRQDTKP